MNFQVLGLEHIDLLRPYFQNNLCRICDCTIGGTFIWRDLFNTEFAIEDGVLYLKVRYLTGDIAFTPPRGEYDSDKSVYERIIVYCREQGLTPRLCAVSEARMERVKALYPDVTAITDRAWSDYLYVAEDIRDLAGRRYSGQRNHINKFLKEYPDWRFEPIGSGNVGAVHEFFRHYAEEHHKNSATYDEGNIKTLEVLEHMDTYGLFGGALSVGGQIVGAALGEIVGDTLFVHIEKSKTEFNGSYPMLVNQFAKAFATGEVTRINREEDDGVEGLRTSKLSYHPCELLNKYVIELG